MATQFVAFHGPQTCTTTQAALTPWQGSCPWTFWGPNTLAGCHSVRTGSNCPQGPHRSHVFLGYLRDFREQLDVRGLQRKVSLVLDGHASHTTFDAVSLAISLDIDLFQLPSHTSHITQPLDVGTFGTFKELTRVLMAYPLKNGGRGSPVKRDMARVIAEGWRGSSTPTNNMAAFKGAGLRPVNMEKAINRLHSKRKQRDNDHPLPEDLAVIASKEQLEQDLGRAALLELKRQGLMIEGLRVNTVFLGVLTRISKRSKIFATARAGGGKPEGGLLGKGSGGGQSTKRSRSWARRRAGRRAGRWERRRAGRRGSRRASRRKEWGARRGKVWRARRDERRGWAKRKGETGVDRDRVAGAAPLVLAEREGGRVGGWGPVLSSKEERDGREGR
ncbi:unnamed protein product [Ectocarpus sp. CCAP 1310/34]|nr:unnamed protein product [Ectocarpus sp. CCAP 1310/34]